MSIAEGTERDLVVEKAGHFVAYDLYFGKLIAADIAQNWSYICRAFNRFNVKQSRRQVQSSQRWRSSAHHWLKLCQLESRAGLKSLDLVISPLHHPFDVFDEGITSGLILTWLEKHASCTISTSFYNNLMQAQTRRFVQKP